MFKKWSIYGALLAAALLFAGCRFVKYSFSGASIGTGVNTVAIAYFPNTAPMVAPILSPTFTDALKDKFARQTRLTLLPDSEFDSGDMQFEGEITGYTSTPAAISGNEYASLNRLTITVRVKFTNNVETQYSFRDARSFSAYADYDSNRLLQEVESSLIPEIVEKLIEDIFNAAVSNW